jgi:hypothetical protein
MVLMLFSDKKRHKVIRIKNSNATRTTFMDIISMFRTFQL